MVLYILHHIKKILCHSTEQQSLVVCDTLNCVQYIKANQIQSALQRIVTDKHFRTVVEVLQCLALLPHIKKVLGSTPAGRWTLLSLHVLPVPAWVLCLLPFSGTWLSVC